jgi:hypothetical protein
LEGYLLIGIAGNPLQLAVLGFCNEFENASTAMSVNCGVFAASSALFIVMKVTPRLHVSCAMLAELNRVRCRTGYCKQYWCFVTDRFVGILRRVGCQHGAWISVATHSVRGFPEMPS